LGVAEKSKIEVAGTGVERDTMHTFDGEVGGGRVLAMAPETPTSKDWKPIKARGQVRLRCCSRASH
jgi:hypothetical protein